MHNAYLYISNCHLYHWREIILKIIFILKFPGCSLANEEPYYSRLPASSNYGNTSKTLDRTEAGAVYFNYLRQFKRKGNNHSRSTQSLPAVTYTVSKNNNKHKKSINKKHVFKSTPRLFRNKHTSNMASTYNDVTSNNSTYKDNKDFFDGKSGYSSGYTGIKRLLIFVCILIGLVLAIGGVLIGFVILPSKTSESKSNQNCTKFKVIKILKFSNIFCVYMQD